MSQTYPLPLSLCSDCQFEPCRNRAARIGGVAKTGCVWCSSQAWLLGAQTINRALPGPSEQEPLLRTQSLQPQAGALPASEHITAVSVGKFKLKGIQVNEGRVVFDTVKSSGSFWDWVPEMTSVRCLLRPGQTWPPVGLWVRLKGNILLIGGLAFMCFRVGLWGHGPLLLCGAG